jgi:hypothetical protein
MHSPNGDKPRCLPLAGGIYRKDVDICHIRREWVNSAAVVGDHVKI